MSVDMPTVKEGKVTSEKFPMATFRYGSKIHPPEGMTSSDVYATCPKCGGDVGVDAGQDISESIYSYGHLSGTPISHKSFCCSARFYTEATKPRPEWSNVDVYCFRIDKKVPFTHKRIRLFRKDLPPIKFTRTEQIDSQATQAV